MSYSKNCDICGQKISMRKMQHGQYVAFDFSTDIPHEHHKKNKIKVLSTKNKTNKKNQDVWSGDDDDVLEELYEKGKTIKQLSNYFNVDENFIIAKLNKLGIDDLAYKSTISIKKNYINKDDEYLYDLAINQLQTEQYISTNFLRKKYSIGYKKAKRIIDKIEEKGFISAADDQGRRRIFTPSLKKQRFHNDKSFDANTKSTANPALFNLYLGEAIGDSKVIKIDYINDNGKSIFSDFFPIRKIRDNKAETIEVYSNLNKQYQIIYYEKIKRIQIYLDRNFRRKNIKPIVKNSFETEKKIKNNDNKINKPNNENQKDNSFTPTHSNDFFNDDTWWYAPIIFIILLFFIVIYLVS